MKRQHSFFILLFLLTVLCGLPVAAERYFCVIEQDTLPAAHENAVKEILDEQLLRLGNEGYPFANLVLNAYERRGDEEYFHYRISKGEQVRIDTVVFGDYRPREISLLTRSLRQPEAGYFHYGKIRETLAELRANPLLEVEERADIYGKGLRLYTKAKQDIRFDAVLAYKQEDEDRGIIGDLSCELINLGGLGRVARFYWSRPTLHVNAIDVAYTEPYILNKPFSVDAAFSQRYQDSLYVKRDWNIGLTFHLGSRAHLSIDYRYEFIATTETGSDSGFVSQRRSGTDLSLFYDSAPRPFRVQLALNSGIRPYPDHLLSRSEAELRISWLPSKLGFHLNVLGGLAASTRPIALYDQYKLGGAVFLRGAYFEQYRSGRFLGWQAEAGYRMGETRMFVFYDGVWMQHAIPLRHHIGIAFALPAGRNRITLALGYDLAESLRQSKVHFIWDMGI